MRKFSKQATLFRGNSQIKACFKQDCNLFQYLNNWDPFVFKQPQHHYRVAQIFDTLDDIIYERKLFDPENTDVIVFDERLDWAYKTKTCLVEHFQTHTEHILIISRSLTHHVNKIINPSWRNESTFISRALSDPDHEFPNGGSRFVVSQSLLNVINFVQSQDVKPHGIRGPFDHLGLVFTYDEIANFVNHYFNVSLGQRLAGNSEIVNLQGSLLKEVTRCSFATRNQIQKAVIANLHHTYEDTNCANCGRKRVPFDHEFLNPQIIIFRDHNQSQPVSLDR